MDVGNPSNFARMLDLYHHNYTELKNEIFGASFSDDQTRAAITNVKEQYHYLFDPHSAIAYLGLKQYQKIHPNLTGIILATAHPAKFSDVVEPVIHEKIPLPSALENAMKKQKVSTLINNNYSELKMLLLVK
jgi:threonine synthase